MVNRLARLLVASLCFATVVGCTGTSPPPAAPLPATRRVEVGFTAQVDATSGKLTFLSLEKAPAAAAGLLAEVPVVRDGVPGSGPANTVELVTESAGTVADGCGVGLNSFEGDVRLRSFYAGARLENAYVQITSMSQTLRTSCNSATPVAGTSDEFALWSYGTLQPAPGPGNDALFRWKLRLPDSTAFTFTGIVVADVVDDYPPHTTDLPGAGTYAAPQTVTLTCADAHLGCSSVTYSLDGGVTWLAYAAPFTVSTTTTVLIDSADPAGNTEARSALYTIDTVKPEVSWIEPRDGRANVPSAPFILVSFSEPPVAAPTIELTLGGVPVAGSVVPYATAQYQFVPDAPLPGSGDYQLRVVASSVVDAAGNAMAADFISHFHTATPVETVSAPGSATVASPGVAWDSTGNGLAVWREMTGAGYRLVYSYFSAAGAGWGTPVVLATWAATDYLLPTATVKVVSNGATFLAAWSTRTGVDAAIFTDGAPGTVKTLLSYSSLADGYDVAANGTSYLVAVSGTSGNVSAWLHAGAWPATPAAVESSLGTADRPVVAPYGASGFVVAFRLNSTSIYQARYNGTAWSAATGVPGASGTATLVGPAVAGSGTRVMVAWAPSTGTTQANVDTGTGFAASATEIGYLAGPPTSLAAAANGNFFAVVWPRANFGANGAIYQQTYWSGAYDLKTGGKAGAVKVASCTGGFTAAFTIGDDGYARPSLWINKTVPSGPNFSWSYTNAVAAEGGTGDVRDPAVVKLGTGVGLAWAQDGGTAHDVVVRAHDGAAFGAQAAVSAPARDGTARQVKLARNGAGDVMAVWTQDHRGGPAVFAARRTGGSWQPPVLLDLNAQSPAVASDGTGFMVVYGRDDVDVTFGSTSRNTVGRRWNGTGFDAPVVVATDGPKPTIASDGASYVVAVARSGRTSVWSVVYQAGAWGTPAQRSTLAGTFDQVSVAGRTGEYLIAFNKLGSPAGPYVVRATSSPGWSWQSAYALDLYGNTTLAGPAVAAGPNGFAVVWRQAAGVQARLLQSGTWGTAQTLTTWADGEVGVASNGTGYVAGWLYAGQLEAEEWNGSWSSSTYWLSTVSVVATDFALASGAGEYEAVFRQTVLGTPSVYAVDVRRDSISSEAWPLEELAEPARAGAALVFDGADWVAAWPQQDPVDPLVDVLKGRWRF